MSYTPNNPYIPGDPYSYDLKWIVEKLKEAISLYQPLNDKFDDLYDYVHDYFANLDLTAEVQAIITQMQQDGYFYNLVDQIVDASGSIQSSVTSWLEANVTPVGSAVIVDDTLTISGAAADAKKAGDIFRGSGIYADVDFTNPDAGHYITANGGYSANPDFSITRPFILPAGTKLIFTGRGYLTMVAMIAEYNGSTYTPLVRSVDSTLRTYEFDNDIERQIVLSYNHDFTAAANWIINVEKEFASINSNFRRVNLIGDVDFSNPDTDHYITATGNYSANTDFSITRPFTLPAGATLEFYGRGYLTNVAMIAEYDGNTYTPLVISVDSTIRPYSYKTEVDVQLVLSYNHDFSANASWINSVLSGKANASIALFENIGVIGDSYASGELYINGSYVDHYNISWPQIIARKNGITAHNYSKGGLTTRSWLTDPMGLALMNSTPADGLYIIALGINDYYSLGAAYLGSTSDIGTSADTFYGNLSKIILDIQAHAPHAKIILSTMANTATLPESFNEAIKNTASYYRLPCIIQGDDDFFKTSLYLTMYGSHPSAIGYSGMATALQNMIEDCIESNINYFKDYLIY